MPVIRRYDGPACPDCESDRIKFRITDDGQDRECFDCGAKWKWVPKHIAKRLPGTEFAFKAVNRCTSMNR
jgi:Zn ribbon nucleic-acid-binding protein